MVRGWWSSTHPFFRRTLSQRFREKGKKKKGRYAMLEANKASRPTSSSTPPMDNLLAQTLAAGGPAAAGSQLNTLVQVEISESFAREEEGEIPKISAGRHLRVFKQQQRGLQPGREAEAPRCWKSNESVQAKKPHQTHSQLHQRSRGRFGRDESNPYQMTDGTKRLSWGKFCTLMRCHYAISPEWQGSVGSAAAGAAAPGSPPMQHRSRRLARSMADATHAGPGRGTQWRIWNEKAKPPLLRSLRKATQQLVAEKARRARERRLDRPIKPRNSPKDE